MVLRSRMDNLHEVDEAKNYHDNLVIHYTTINALASMLSYASLESETHTTDGPEKSLWRLYDSVHLNDPDEGVYFSRNLKLPKRYDWLTKEGVSHAYIASFVLPDGGNDVDMGDNLVFWQTYGKEGEGCSLALPIRRSLLRKVLYGTEQMKPIRRILEPALKSLAESVEPLVKIRNRRLQSDVKERIAEVVWQYIERFRYLYKSEAYAHERECRLVVPESEIEDKSEISFVRADLNIAPFVIRHYYEHKDLQIRSLLATGSTIILGPRVANAENVCFFVNELRRRAGILPQKIKISTIPYQKF